MQKIKNFWSDFKTFDWKMFLALCLLALVPTIYQTVVTKIISVNTNYVNINMENFVNITFHS